MVITSLSGQAVEIDKSTVELLQDKELLEEIESLYSQVFGDAGEVTGSGITAHVGVTDTLGDSDNSGPGDGDGTASETGGGNDTSDDGTSTQDDPPIVGDDLFGSDEDTSFVGNLFDDNGGGPDVDPDGFSLNVTAINGQPLVFDASGLASVVLPSGAILLVRANGDFTYSPVPAFQWLADDEQTQDIFTEGGSGKRLRG